MTGMQDGQGNQHVTLFCGVNTIACPIISRFHLQGTVEGRLQVDNGHIKMKANVINDSLILG